MDRRKSVRVRARLSVRRIVVPKRRFEIGARADARNRNGPKGWRPSGRCCLSRSWWWNDLPCFR